MSHGYAIVRGMTTKDVGHRGEEIAVQYLEALGWAILDRNWHCRYGELDIVALDREKVVTVVEVKYRSTTTFGGGAAAVTAEKLLKLRRATALWLRERREELRERGLGQAAVAIDVIDVGPQGVRDHVVGCM